ncbi:MAG: rhomboid family intramembrane serine protease, partial [Halobacteriaceae archaeon]
MFLIGMGVIFLCEVAAGIVLGKSVAKVPQLLSPWAYLALAPWVHSDLMHIVQNSAMFMLFGYFIERRVGRWEFTGFVLAAGYLSLYVPV